MDDRKRFLLLHYAFTAFVLVARLVDIILDIALADKVTRAGYAGYGFLLGLTTVFSIIIGYASKSAASDLGENSWATAVWNICCGEALACMLQDATTIMVYIEVPGLYDPDNGFDVANVVVTLMNNICVIIGLTVAFYYSHDSGKRWLAWIPLVSLLVYEVHVLTYHVIGEREPDESNSMGSIIAAYVFCILFGLFGCSEATLWMMSCFDDSLTCDGDDGCCFGRSDRSHEV